MNESLEVNLGLVWLKYCKIVFSIDSINYIFDGIRKKEIISRASPSAYTISEFLINNSKNN